MFGLFSAPPYSLCLQLEDREGEDDEDEEDEDGSLPVDGTDGGQDALEQSSSSYEVPTNDGNQPPDVDDPEDF